MNGFTNISSPKIDKPFLLTQGTEITFDCNDVDGQLAMLDRSFSGCVTLPFSKPMNPEVPGIVLLDGQPVPTCIKSMKIAGGRWLLGARVKDMIDAYDTRYTLTVEGFTDTDGNTMLPVTINLKTLPKREPQLEFATHESIALQAAEEGIVLLKNENNALPMPPCTLNVFGNALHWFRSAIVGAGKINPRYTVNLKEAISSSQEYSLNDQLADFYKTRVNAIPDEPMLEHARQLCDAAVIVLTRISGENLDNSSAKGEFYLTFEEDALIRRVTEYFEKTIVILNTPYPIDVTFVKKYNVDALVYAGIGGMLGGQALLNVLSGKINPSGKLPDTWAYDYFDMPSSRNFYDCAKDGERLDADTDVWMDTVYEEDIYVGYRYFDTFAIKPAYPFGYGLSYTTFATKANPIAFNTDEGLICLAMVTNTGTVEGKEVIQVYIGKPDCLLEHPTKELIGFEKTRLLQPGEEQELHFSIPLRHLTSYDTAQAAYIMEAGTYSIYLGNSVEHAKLIGSFIQQKSRIIKQVKNRMQPVQTLNTLTKSDPLGSYPTGKDSGIKKGVSNFEPVRLHEHYIPSKQFISLEKKLDFQDVVNNQELADAFIAQLTVDELCRMTVCASSGWGMNDTGVAGRLTKLQQYDLPTFEVSDGNCGVNVKSPNIGFPASVTCCASFNKKLIYDVGRVLGEEGKALGVSLMLAPALNIHRNPLNGRHPEYFSEDPYLAGIMGGYYCAGLEGTGMGGCYKHCIANNCESSRKRNQSIMTERAIREIYFRVFEFAMEIHTPKSIMNAYNAVNGVHTAADGELIRGLFREENGFNGFVMTDWNSYDTCDVVAMIQGGTNWITPGSLDETHTKPLKDAVEDGTLPLVVLQESVAYLVRAIAQLQASKEDIHK